MDFETRVAEAKRHIRATSIDGVQRRVAALDRLEVRAKGDDGFEVEGHAAVFNDLSENLGGFREKVDPGAFAKVLEKGPDVRALFNHDPNLVLARTGLGEDNPGWLRVQEDDTGLAYAFEPTRTSYANDLRANLDAGVVDQSSFAFRVARGGDSWDEDEESGLLIRTIHEFSGLYDVSPVTYPAYPTTDAGTSSTGLALVPEFVFPFGTGGNLTTSHTAPERKAKADVQEQAETAGDGDERANDGGLRARRLRLLERG